ncbi:MAG: murein biosynthesis integral membrane protein MurJ [Alphaproteobacteria bacterium]|nr:murein biosynthesis integral membrane protein MurJ [Alphaproteobacteria bacterium]
MSLLRSIATIGGFTLLSRVTGFARDILTANVLGAGVVADVFFVAFKFPNLFRRLFAEGAFSAAFVPIYAGMVERDGLREANLFAERALAVLGTVLLAFVALMELAMPWAMYGFAPGFGSVPGKIELAVEMTRITFPYLVFISVVSLQAGVLNSLGRFAAAAAAPILLNLTMIGALLALSPITETPGHALSWGVAAAGLFQLAWLSARCARAGAALRLVRPRFDDRVRLLLRRIAPVAFGAGLYQINLLVDTILASTVANGAVSFLYYADRVNQFPLGVVGVAVGTALLPLLSRRLGAGDEAGAMTSQNRALEFALLLTVPAAVALMLTAGPVVSVLFERGAFGPAERDATAAALAAFAVGLPAFVLIKALTPGFFARHDTATPVRCAAVALVANVVLSLILMGSMKHVGIALASSLSSWLNAGLLATILHRRGFLAIDARLRSRLPRLFFSCSVLGGVMALGLRGLEPFLSGPLAVRSAALALLVAGGLGAFALLAQLTGLARLSDLRSMMRGQDAPPPPPVRES